MFVHTFPFALSLALALAIPRCLIAQPGCPDAQALNYAAGASPNDGSCLYPVTNYVPQLKSTLPNDLNEISGLQLAGNRWWAHEDSGNDNVFYNITPETGVIQQTVKLKQAENRDWEDIATDGTRLYIGDFGNNTNDRQNLGIYRVPLSVIGNSSTPLVDADEYTFIPFAYADQTDFTTQPEANTQFDCEAMVYFGGKIHLFTKNRLLNRTTHYVVNQTTGLAENMETLEVNGLITAADISPDGKLVTLLGYNLNGLPTVFCWLLWDWHDGLFFNGNKRRIEFGSAFSAGQAESIAFAGNRNGYIANELTQFNGVTLVPPTVRAVDFAQWVPETVATQTPSDDTALRLYPNPFTSTVRLRLPDHSRVDAVRVYNALGQIIATYSGLPDAIDTSDWPAGWYRFAGTGPTGVFSAIGVR